MKQEMIFGKIYSPYVKDGKETMNEWYEEYLKDSTRVFEKDGRKYSKIIHRCEFYAKGKNTLLVVLVPQEEIRLGDIMLDEMGREFTVTCFEMFRFAGKIPDWYPQAVSMSVIGTSYEIGDYLGKMR